MAKDKISGKVTHTVTLGRNGYADRVQVTGTGQVIPSVYGGNAVIIPSGLSNAYLSNDGLLRGGVGQSNSNSHGAGGIGLVISGSNGAFNDGLLIGGAGGTSSTTGGHGGAGVSLGAGADLFNQATVTGGAGGV